MNICSVGMDFEHIARVLNFVADAISRGTPAETLNRLFKRKCPSNPSACSSLQVQSSETKLLFKCFLPSAEMSSTISYALLQQNMPTSLPTNPKARGHCVPEKNISLDFSKERVWTLH